MAAKEQKVSFLDKPVFRIILKVISIVIAAVILLFSTLAIVEISDGTYTTAPHYLIWIFLFSGLMSIVVLLKDRTKINLIKSIILLVFNTILGIVILFAKDNPFIFSLTAGLYCLGIVIQCIFNMVRQKTVRAIIFNLLIISFAIALGIGMIVSPIQAVEQIQNIIIVECVFIAVVSFIEAVSVAFSELKVKVLVKIVLSTFSLEILFGLLTMIACFSFILMKVEPNITNYPEALWYCFAIVTTIGFGDFVAVTPVGRVLSVFLGIYGLVVVAVITSIVVNFYNETSGKNDKKQLDEIAEEEKQKEKKK